MGDVHGSQRTRSCQTASSAPQLANCHRGLVTTTRTTSGPLEAAPPSASTPEPVDDGGTDTPAADPAPPNATSTSSSPSRGTAMAMVIIAGDSYQPSEKERMMGQTEMSDFELQVLTCVLR